jgi:hypothetical protein
VRVRSRFTNLIHIASQLRKIYNDNRGWGRHLSMRQSARASVRPSRTCREAFRTHDGPLPPGDRHQDRVHTSPGLLLYVRTVAYARTQYYVLILICRLYRRVSNPHLHESQSRDVTLLSVCSVRSVPNATLSPVHVWIRDESGGACAAWLRRRSYTDSRELLDLSTA